MRKQEERLKDAIRSSMDGKPVRPIQKRKHLTAFERKMRDANKLFGWLRLLGASASYSPSIE
jgi:hypothetical protein